MNNSRLELIEQMLKSNPNDAFLNYAAALEFKKNGDITKAISILEQLSDIDESYLPTYYQLGKCYERQNEVTKAIDAYKKGITFATQQTDNKTLLELKEALFLLTDE